MTSSGGGEAGRGSSIDARVCQWDAIEKLPVTPGPIIPAREQLGDLLLEQNHPDLALKEFEALWRSPRGGGGQAGAEHTAELSRR